MPELKKYRTNLLNSTNVAVIFNGGKGTEAEVEVAINRNCNIIPVIENYNDRDSEVIKKILKENKLGRYVPICTHRAFSKYYSKSSKEMIFWKKLQEWKEKMFRSPMVTVTKG